MADVLEEQQNPTSTTAKQTEERALRAKEHSGKRDAGPGQGSKKSKGTEKNSSSSNRSKAKKKDKKGSKSSESSAQDMKDNDFSCLINYSLNSDSSDLSDLSDSSESDASEASCSKSESKRTAHKATKSDKRQRHSGPIKTDFWLYDTGSSVHIVNNRKWFKEYKPNTGNLRPVYTGGGPVTPKGVGTVVLETLYTTEGEDKYRTVSLHSVLLIPQLDVNIFSGIKHYAAGGSLGYNRLYGSNRKPFALLNFTQSCFFLSLKGYPVPRADHAHFSYLADIHHSYHISYSVEEFSDPEDNAELSGNITPEQPATKSVTHLATATTLATDRY